MDKLKQADVLESFRKGEKLTLKYAEPLRQFLGLSPAAAAPSDGQADAEADEPR